MKKRLLALGLAGMIAATLVFPASADEIADLQDEAAWSESQYAEYAASIDNLTQEQNILFGQIDEADQQLVVTIATINLLDMQIEEKTAQLAQTTADLAVAEEEEAIEYAAMKKRIQYLYETGGNAGWATILLEEANITDFLNQTEYTQKIYEYDRNCLEQYAATVEHVSSLKKQQELEKQELEAMRFEQEQGKAYLEQLLEELRATSSDYDAKLAYANEMAASYASILQQQYALIDELMYQRELERQAAAAAAAAAAAEAAAAAQMQAAMNAGAQVVVDPYTGGATYVDPNTGGEVYIPPVEEVYIPPAPPEPDYSYASGNAIVDRAYSWVGRAEYVWGGCSPGAFDCSGFVSYCLTGAYARLGTTGTFMGWPRVSEPMPGDVCITAGHCGIYIGDGMMIHAADVGIGVVIGSSAGMGYVRY